jgi:hypothetical protein
MTRRRRTADPLTLVATLDGIPAWLLARVCSAIAVNGVLSFGLTTAVQPAAKAGPFRYLFGRRAEW